MGGTGPVPTKILSEGSTTAELPPSRVEVLSDVPAHEEDPPLGTVSPEHARLAAQQLELDLPRIGPLALVARPPLPGDSPDAAADDTGAGEGLEPEFLRSAYYSGEADEERAPLLADGAPEASPLWTEFLRLHSLPRPGRAERDAQSRVLGEMLSLLEDPSLRDPATRALREPFRRTARSLQDALARGDSLPEDKVEDLRVMLLRLQGRLWLGRAGNTVTAQNQIASRWEAYRHFRAAGDTEGMREILDGLRADLDGRFAEGGQLQDSDRLALRLRVLRERVARLELGPGGAGLHFDRLQREIATLWSSGNAGDAWLAHRLMIEYARARQSYAEIHGAGADLEGRIPAAGLRAAGENPARSLQEITAELAARVRGNEDGAPQRAQLLQLAQAYGMSNVAGSASALLDEVEASLREDGVDEFALRGALLLACENSGLGAELDRRIASWTNADLREGRRRGDGPAARMERLHDWAGLVAGLQEIGEAERAQALIARIAEETGALSVPERVSVYNELLHLEAGEAPRLPEALKTELLAQIRASLAAGEPEPSQALAMERVLIDHTEDAAEIESIAIHFGEGADTLEASDLQASLELRRAALEGLARARSLHQARLAEHPGEEPSAGRVAELRRAMQFHHARYRLALREGAYALGRAGAEPDTEALEQLNAHYPFALSYAHEHGIAGDPEAEVAAHQARARGAAFAEIQALREELAAGQETATTVAEEYEAFLQGLAPESRLEGLSMALAQQLGNGRLSDYDALLPLVEETLAAWPAGRERREAILRLAPLLSRGSQAAQSLQRQRRTELNQAQGRLQALATEGETMATEAAWNPVRQREIDTLRRRVRELQGLLPAGAARVELLRRHETALWSRFSEGSSDPGIQSFARAMAEAGQGHDAEARRLFQALLADPAFGAEPQAETATLRRIAETTIGVEAQSRIDRTARVLRALFACRASLWEGGVDYHSRMRNRETREAFARVMSELPAFLGTLSYEEMPQSFEAALDLYARSSPAAARHVRVFDGILSRLPQAGAEDGVRTGSVWNLVRRLDRLDTEADARALFASIREILGDDTSHAAMNAVRAARGGEFARFGEGLGDLGPALQDLCDLLLEEFPDLDPAFRAEIEGFRRSIPEEEEAGASYRELFSLQTALEVAMEVSVFAATGGVGNLAAAGVTRLMVAGLRMAGRTAGEQLLRQALLRGTIRLGAYATRTVVSRVLGTLIQTPLQGLLAGQAMGDLDRAAFNMVVDTMGADLLMQFVGPLRIPGRMMGRALQRFGRSASTRLSARWGERAVASLARPTGRVAQAAAFSGHIAVYTGAFHAAGTARFETERGLHAALDADYRQQVVAEARARRRFEATGNEEFLREAEAARAAQEAILGPEALNNLRQLRDGFCTELAEEVLEALIHRGHLGLGPRADGRAARHDAENRARREIEIQARIHGAARLLLNEEILREAEARYAEGLRDRINFILEPELPAYRDEVAFLSSLAESGLLEDMSPEAIADLREQADAVHPGDPRAARDYLAGLLAAAGPEAGRRFHRGGLAELQSAADELFSPDAAGRRTEENRQAVVTLMRAAGPHELARLPEFTRSALDAYRFLAEGAPMIHGEEGPRPVAALEAWQRLWQASRQGTGIGDIVTAARRVASGELAIREVIEIEAEASGDFRLRRHYELGEPRTETLQARAHRAMDWLRANVPALRRLERSPRPEDEPLRERLSELRRADRELPSVLGRLSAVDRELRSAVLPEDARDDLRVEHESLRRWLGEVSARVSRFARDLISQRWGTGDEVEYPDSLPSETIRTTAPWTPARLPSMAAAAAAVLGFTTAPAHAAADTGAMVESLQGPMEFASFLSANLGPLIASTGPGQAAAGAVVALGFGAMMAALRPTYQNLRKKAVLAEAALEELGTETDSGGEGQEGGFSEGDGQPPSRPPAEPPGGPGGPPSGGPDLRRAAEAIVDVHEALRGVFQEAGRELGLRDLLRAAQVLVSLDLQQNMSSLFDGLQLLLGGQFADIARREEILGQIRSLRDALGVENTDTALREAARLLLADESVHDFPGLLRKLAQHLDLPVDALTAHLLREAPVEFLREYLASADSEATISWIRSHRPVHGRILLREFLHHRKAEIKEAAMNGLCELQDREAIPLIRPFLKSRNEFTRVTAIDVLGRLGDRESLPVFRKLLQGRSEMFRESALEALFELNDAESADLVRPLLKDRDGGVARLARCCLAKWGDEAARQALEKAKGREDSSNVLEDLIALDDRKSLPWIREQLAAAWDEELSNKKLFEAVRAVVHFEDRESIPRLRDLLEEVWGYYPDPTDDLSKLMDALSRLGDTKSLDLIRDIYEYGNEATRDAAFEALNRLDPAWTESWQQKAEGLWQTVVEEMGRKWQEAQQAPSQDPTSLERLFPALSQWQARGIDWPARLREMFGRLAANEEWQGDLWSIVEAIGREVGLEEGRVWHYILRQADVEEAISMLGSGSLDYGIKASIITWLGELGDPGAVPALLKCLTDKTIRSQVAEALGRLGDTSAVPDFLKRLRDENSAVRIESVGALGWLGDASAVPALLERLGDEDRYVRRAVPEALGRLGDASAVPALLKSLRDEDEKVRRAAAEALRRLGDASAVPALLERLGDKDPYVRLAAAEALGRLGDASAVPALLERLGDEDPYVRRAAAEALGRLGDASAVPALLESLGDEALYVRVAADKALDRLQPGWSQGLVPRWRDIQAALGQTLEGTFQSSQRAVEGLASHLPLRSRTELAEDLRRLIPEAEPIAMIGPTAEALRGLIAGIAGNQPVFLEGETGTGKNAMLRYLAHQTGTPLFRIQFTRDTDASHLFGHFEVEAFTDAAGVVRRRVVFRDGRMLEAMLSGGWAIWDEVNLASSGFLVSQNDVLQAIASAVQDRKVWIRRGNEVVEVPVHEHFRLFATGNPESYAGRKELEASFGSRWLRIGVREFSVEEQTSLLQQRAQSVGAQHVEPLQGLSEASSQYIPQVLHALKVATGGGITLRTLLRVARRIAELESQGETLWTVGAQHVVPLLTESGMKAFVSAFEAEVLDGLNAEAYANAVQALAMALPRGTLEIASFLTQESGKGQAWEERRREFRKRLQEQRRRVLAAMEQRGETPPAECSTWEELVEVPTTVSLAAKVLDSFAREDFVLIEGPPAVSKSAVPRWLGRLLQQEVVEITGSPEMEVADLIGSPTLDQAGGLIFQEGPLIRALQSGAIFVVNEANLIPAEVMERLNSLLDDDRMIYVVENGRRVPIHAHPNFRLVFTQNPAGLRGGRRELSPALVNKFRKIQIRQGFAAEELQTILAEQQPTLAAYVEPIVHLFHGVQELLQAQGIDLSLRDLKRLGDITTGLSQVLSPTEALTTGAELVFTGRFRDAEARDALRPELDRFQEAIAQVTPMGTDVSPLRRLLQRILASEEVKDLSQIFDAIAQANDWADGDLVFSQMLSRANVEEALEMLSSDLSRDKKRGVAIIRRLGVLGNSRAVPALIERLGSKSSSFHHAAAEALSQLGETRALPVLLESLGDKDWIVRRNAAENLGRLGDQWAVPALLESLNDLYSSVSHAAVVALGQLGDTSAVPLLLPRLREDDTRLAAVVALGQLGDPSVIPALRKWLKKDNKNPQVRSAAFVALDRLGDPTVVPTLIETLGDDNEMPDRMSAAEVLGQLGDTSAVPALIEALENKRHDYVCAVAAEVLGQLGDPSAVPALLKSLVGGKNIVQSAAAEALGRLGDTSAVPALLERLGDEDLFVRKAAAEALGRLGDASAVSALLDRLEDKDQDVRHAAAEALNRLQPGWDQDLIPTWQDLQDVLQQSLVTAQGETRVALERLLGALGSWRRPEVDWVERLRPTIRRLLASEHIEGHRDLMEALAKESGLPFPTWVREVIRCADFEELLELEKSLDKGAWKIEDILDTESFFDLFCLRRAEFQDDEAQDMVVRTIMDDLDGQEEDPDQFLKSTPVGLTALGRRGDPKRIPIILRALKSRHPEIVAAAVEALGHFHEPEAVKGLYWVLRNYGIRSCELAPVPALRALAKIGDPRAIPAIRRFLNEIEVPNATPWGTDTLPWRSEAAAALQRLGEAGEVERLAVDLSGEDEALRLESAIALASIGDARGRDILIANLRLGAEDPDLIIEAMAALRDPDCVEPLLETLEDSENMEPFWPEVISALGKIGDPRAIPALTRIAGDRVGVFEWMAKAATALGEIGDPRVLSDLYPLLESEDEEVSIAAQGALSKMDPNWSRDRIPPWRAIREVLAEKAAGQQEATGTMTSALSHLPRWEARDATHLGVTPQVRAELQTLIPAEEPLALIGPTAEALRGLIAGIAGNQPVFLEGETGTGKNAMLRYLAHQTQTPLFRFQFTRETDASHLFGHFEVEAFTDAAGVVRRRVVFRDGRMLEAMLHGGWAVWDEMNLASQGFLVSQNEVLQGIARAGVERKVWVRRGNDVVEVPVHEHFRLFATGNPESYAGRKELETSFGSRWLRIGVREFSVEEQTSLLQQRAQSVGAQHVEPLQGLSEASSQYIPQVLHALKVATGAGITLRTLLRVASRIAELESQGETLWTVGAQHVVPLLTESGMKAFVSAFEAEVLDGLNAEAYANAVQALAMALPRGTLEIAPFLAQAAANEQVWTERRRAFRSRIEARRKHLLKTIKQRSETPLTECSTWENLVEVPTTVNLASKVLDSFDRGDFVLIEGPPAVSKSAVPRWLGRLLQQEVIEVTGTPEMEVSDIIGAPTLDENAQLIFQDGPLIRALQRGAILVVNEANLIPPDVMERLNSLLDDDRMIYVIENGRRVPILAHPNFRLVFTQNPAGLRGGRRELSPALVNKFRKIQIREGFAAEELQAILAEQQPALASYVEPIVHLFHGVQELLQLQGIDLTLRDLKRLGDITTGLSQVLSPTEALMTGAELVFTGRFRDAETREALRPELDRFQEAIGQVRPNKDTTSPIQELITRILASEQIVDLRQIIDAIAKVHGWDGGLVFRRMARRADVEGVLKLWDVAQELDKKRVVIHRLEELKAVPALIGCLGDKNQYVRSEVSMVLGRLGDVSAVPALLERLGDERSLVRMEAVKALGRLGDVSAVPALLERLADNDPNIPYSAAEALGRLGDVSAVPALLVRLGDDNPRVCSEACRVLGRLGDVRAVPALLERLGDQDPGVPYSAAWALGELGDVRAVPALIERLKEERPHVRSAVARTLGRLGDVRAVPALIERLGDEDPHVRSCAANALGALGDVRAVPTLLEHLRDKGPGVQSAVARALGALGDVRAVPALLDLLDDETSEFRSSAADALGVLGNVSAVPTLLQRLGNDDPEARYYAALILGKSGHVSAVPALIERLDDEDPGVSSTAADALGALGDTRAVPALLEHLDDERPNVRSAAAQALGRLGDTRAVPALFRRLEDEKEYVRSAAAEALERLQPDWDQDLVPTWQDLQDALQQNLATAQGEARVALERLLGALGSWRRPEVDWETRLAGILASEEVKDLSQIFAAIAQANGWGDGRLVFEKMLHRADLAEALAMLSSGLIPDESKPAIITRLGELGDTRVVPALLESLGDKDRTVRREAAESLGRLGDTSAVPAFLERLGEKDPTVRHEAVIALGRLGDMKAVPALLESLKDKEWTVRHAAVEALGRLGDLSAVPALLESLKDKEWYVRYAAVEALGRLGDLSAVPALLERLKDVHSMVRRMAAKALGQLGDASAVPSLLERLGEKDPMVRHAAIEALRRLGNTSILPTLLEKLEDKDNRVRFDAAKALSRFGDARAFPVLIESVEDTDFYRRRDAVEALGKLGDPSAIPALRKRLRDEKPEIRHAALEALDQLDPNWDQGFVPRWNDIQAALGQTLEGTFQSSQRAVEGLASRLPLRSRTELAEDLRRLIPEAEPLALIGPTVEALRGLIAGIAGNQPVFLEGETGTGKNAMLRYLAHQTGTPLFRVQFTRDTDASHLFGHFEVEAFTDAAGVVRRRVVFRDGRMLEAMLGGGWAIWDEVNLASSGFLVSQNDVLQAISAAVQDRKVWIRRGNEVVEVPVHDHFRLFATGNPESYAGRKELEASFGSRWLRIGVREFSVEEQTSLLQQRTQSVGAQHVEPLQGLGEASIQYIPQVLHALKVATGGGITLRTLLRVARRIAELESQDETLWTVGAQHVVPLLTASGMKAFVSAFEAEVLDGLNAEAYANAVQALAMALPRGNLEIAPFLTQEAAKDKAWEERRKEFRKSLQKHRQGVLAAMAQRGETPPTECSTWEALIEVPTTVGLAAKVLDSFAREDFVLIEGPPAVSKSAVPRWLGRLLQQEVIEVTGSPEMEVADLIGSPTLDQAGGLIFQEGPLIRALQSGAIFVVNEANLIPAEVMERLNSLLDDDRMIYVVENGRRVPILAHPNFRLVFTQNPAGLRGGRRELSPALVNKFRKIRIRDDFSRDEKVRIVERALTGQPPQSPPPSDRGPTSPRQGPRDAGGISNAVSSGNSKARTQSTPTSPSPPVSPPPPNSTDMTALPKAPRPPARPGTRTSPTPRKSAGATMATVFHPKDPAKRRAVEDLPPEEIRHAEAVAKAAEEEMRRQVQAFMEEHGASLQNLGGLGALRPVRIEVDLSGETDIASMEMDRGLMRINPLAILKEGLTPGQIAAVALHEGGHAAITRVGDGFFFEKKSRQFLANALEDPRVNEYELQRLPGAREDFRALYRKFFPSPEQVQAARARGESSPLGALPHEQFALAFIDLWANGELTERVDNAEVAEAVRELEAVARKIWATQPDFFHPRERDVMAKQNEVYRLIREQVLPVYERFYQESVEEIESQLRQGKPGDRKSPGRRGGAGTIDQEDLSEAARRILEQRAEQMAEKLAPHNPVHQSQAQQARERAERRGDQEGKAGQGGYQESDFRPFDQQTFKDILAQRAQRAKTREAFYDAHPWRRYFDPVREVAAQVTEVLRQILKLDTDFEWEGNFVSGPKLNVRRAIEAILRQEAGILNDEDFKLFLRKRIPTRRSHRFVLLLDESGSMKGNEAETYALQSVALFQHVLEQLRVDHAIVGFADSADLHRDFGEAMADERRRSALMEELKSSGGGGTNDLGGLKFSEKLLESQEADEKTVIVITDGAGVAEAKDYVQAMEARGITVIAIGLGAGTEEVAEVYGHYYQSHDFQQLPKTLLRILSRRLLNLPGR